MAAARADMRTAAKPTADQMRVLKILEQLAGAADWRGVAAQERAARAVAAAVRTSMPSKAAWVYRILGKAYQSLGSFSKALEHHKEHLTMAKELGDRAEEGGAYGNLGNAYQSQGDFSQAITYHTQRLAIAKEVGDRAGEGRAYANLGNAYQSQGDFNKAIEYHTLHLAIAKEVGDRAGEGQAYGHLGTCHMHLNECVKAVSYFEAQHVMATSLKLAHVQSAAALNMGVALTLRVRAAGQGHVAGADQAPGPHSRSSASACLDDRVCEAAKWLQAALDGGCPFANLHLAHLTFDAGQEDAALAHLKEHLSWRVQRGRDTCAWCRQTRGEDTPMLCPGEVLGRDG